MHEEMAQTRGTFEESVVITARMYMPRSTIVRRCLMDRSRPVFSDLIESVEKLFGNDIKLCPGSFYYTDSSEDHVTFSSDEELAIAFSLAEKELKIGVAVADFPPGNEFLKVENPSSSDSSPVTSLESSPSQHSTPTQDPQQKIMNRGDIGNSTPALYRSKIIPKLFRRYSLDNTCHNSATFIIKDSSLDGGQKKQRRDNGNCNCNFEGNGNQNSEERKDYENQTEGKGLQMSLAKGGNVAKDRESLLNTLKCVLERVCDWLFLFIMRAVH